MSRLEISRGNKGLWQRVEALWRSMLPRQARVTRTDGGTVWVRFVDEGSDAPESQFPSTVAGVAAGTMGWVITLGGKKGLFVATGVSTGGGGGLVDSVNGKIGNVTLDADDINDTGTSHKFVTGTDLTKLANLSGVNTGDQDLSGLATKAELASKADGSTLLSALPAAIGSNGQVLKVQSGGVSWEPDLNTTYAEISEAEINTGTASASRAISGRRAQSIVNKARTDLETTSQLNSRDTANRSRANHTGTQLAATISDFSATVAAHTDVSANTSSRHTHANKTTLDAVTAAYTTAEKTKLSGVATGATANATDAALRARSSHTGTQLAATISDFSTTVASHSAVAANTAARHTHSNKAVLDAVTAAYTTAMNTKLSGITAGADMTSAEYLIATSGPATGAKVKPVATGNRAVAIGGGAIADGDYANAMGAEANAVGANSTAIGYQTSSFSNSTAIGYQAITTANNANAIGYGAKVDAVQASALGRFSTVLSTEPFTTEIGGQVLRVLRRDPSRNALAFASSLQLADTTGALHTIGADKDYGLSYDGLAVLSRANHVGNQAIHTITNLQEILDGKPLVVDVGNRSTAIGVDAQAVGASSFAAGDTATALGVNSIAIGVDSDATGLDSTAVGQDANATNTRATAVGRDSNASGEDSAAYGHGAAATGNSSVAVGVSAKANAPSGVSVGWRAVAHSSGSVAFGGLADAEGQNSAALGTSTHATGERSIAIGSNNWADGIWSTAIGLNARAAGQGSMSIGRLALTSVGEDFTTEVAASTIRIARRSTVGGPINPTASTLQLADATGTLHTIGATPGALTYDGAVIGQTHSYSHNASPAAESLTGVGTYDTAGVLRTDTLQSLIPEITTGLWNVDVVASATVYRSVATGGVWLWIGNGTTAYHQVLGRLSPQTHAYTLTMFVGPNNGATNLTPTSVLDLRYTGFSTAGTTNVVSHGWQITARRVG